MIIKKYFTLVLFFVVGVCDGQVNLVPNPSFEIYDTCPYTTAQVPFALGWHNYGKTPDYFNACATNYMSVPTNVAGFQNAKEGNAYCGMQFINYADTTYREFIGASLSSPLQIGQTYYVSAYFNLADNPSLAIGVNKLCIRFSTHIYSQNAPPMLDNFAQVVSDSIIEDTIGWYHLKKSFIADSAYTQIIIGNFFSGYLTDTLLLFGPGMSSTGYYIVDMVCVSTDSNTCSQSASGTNNFYESNEQVEIKCFDDYILLTNITSNPIAGEISILDLLGKQIFSQRITIDKSNRIPVQYLTPSIYFFSIKTKDKKQTTKIIKR